MRCVEGHDHRSVREGARCEARHYDATGLVKMARVSFSGPRKIAHVYAHGIPGERGGLRVLVFAEEEIVPWRLGEEQPAAE